MRRLPSCTAAYHRKMTAEESDQEAVISEIVLRLEERFPHTPPHVATVYRAVDRASRAGMGAPVALSLPRD